MYTITVCGQKKSDKAILGVENARQELKSALNDKSRHNVIDYKTEIIRDSVTAIKIAESILFNIYGKKNIVRQRPYENYRIDNYWVITGTLSKNSMGGTFLIIIDSINSEIIKITHGK